MGLFRRNDEKPKKPKSLFFPEPSSSGVDPAKLAAGLPAQGAIKSVDTVGASWTDGPGGMPAPFCNVVLEVTLAGEAPYEATCRQSIPGMKVSQVQAPNATFPVRVNPDDHADVAIDFNAK